MVFLRDFVGLRPLADEVGPAVPVLDLEADVDAAARDRGVVAVTLLRAVDVGVGVLVREIFLDAVFAALLATNEDEPGVLVEADPAAAASVSVLRVRDLGVVASVLALGIFLGGFCHALLRSFREVGRAVREVGEGDLLLACGFVMLGGGLFHGLTLSDAAGAFDTRVGGDGAFLELALADDEFAGGDGLLDAREGLMVLERGTLPGTLVPEEEPDASFGPGDTLRAGRVVLIVLALGVLSVDDLLGLALLEVLALAAASPLAPASLDTASAFSLAASSFSFSSSIALRRLISSSLFAIALSAFNLLIFSAVSISSSFFLRALIRDSRSFFSLPSFLRPALIARSRSFISSSNSLSFD